MEYPPSDYHKRRDPCSIIVGTFYAHYGGEEKFWRVQLANCRELANRPNGPAASKRRFSKLVRKIEDRLARIGPK